jgi:proline dehydrogenase
MISFDNTEIAFRSKTNVELNRAYKLYKIVSSSTFVSFGKWATNVALTIRFPIKRAVKATIFKQFCGGETIAECDNTIQQLWKYGIGTILDYSVEGKNGKDNFEITCQEILNTVERANQEEAIPYSVFKVTGLAPFSLLEKMSNGTKLSEKEKKNCAALHIRIDRICHAAFEADTPVFIDAEESWIQKAIDDLSMDMMAKYNQKRAIVYNTIQLYRWDRLEYIKTSKEKAEEESFLLGLKLVRGAYMEKERDRALEKGYRSPIQNSKKETDKDYNLSLEYCVLNIDRIEICAGTHNEKSSLYLTELMETHRIKKNDPRICFAQLLGMSDHISYNLSNAGYKVAKYVPYGPVEEVLPYLLRRADENTSVAGQTTRELSLIIKERKRRRST